jgi:hypothetical protein
MAWSRSAPVVLLVIACACSAKVRNQIGAGATGSGSVSGSGGSSGVGLSTAQGSGGFQPSGSSGSSNPGDCSEAAKLVYVVGTGNELYSFAPGSLKFTKIGTLKCASIGNPFSMAVDRQGMAWVLYDDAQLFKVDTSNAACAKTSYQPSQLGGFSKFGMGFATNDGMSTDETLYLASYDGVGIAKLSFPALKVTSVGAYNKLSGPAELTGTGDGKLYGFFLTNPVQVAQIDKNSGKILSQAPQASVQIGAAWAFAFWGGDFWLFTSPNGFSSQVDRYQPSKKTTDTVVQSVGFNIVGAGVSTCAPVVNPN